MNWVDVKAVGSVDSLDGTMACLMAADWVVYLVDMLAELRAASSAVPLAQEAAD